MRIDDVKKRVTEKVTEKVTDEILKEIEDKFHEYLTPEKKVKMAVAIYAYMDNKYEVLEAGLMDCFAQGVLVGFDILVENRNKIRDLILEGMKPETDKVQ